MTTPIQIIRYGRAVRRLMNIVGEGGIVTGVLEDVFPIIDLERQTPEARRYSGWDLGVSGSTLSSLAGLTSRVYLSNPPASNKLAVVTKVTIHTSSTQSVFGGLGSEPLTDTGNFMAQFRDTRNPTPVSSLITRMPVLFSTEISSAGATPADGIRLVTQANTILKLEDPEDGLAVLAPGTDLHFRSGTPGTALTVTFWWRERDAEPAELKP